MPKTRTEFWEDKIRGNVERDANARDALLGRSWRVLTVWECALKGKYRLAKKDVLEAITGWVQVGPDCHEIRGTA